MEWWPLADRVFDSWPFIAWGAVKHHHNEEDGEPQSMPPPPRDISRWVAPLAAAMAGAVSGIGTAYLTRSEDIVRIAERQQNVLKEQAQQNARLDDLSSRIYALELSVAVLRSEITTHERRDLETFERKKQ